MAKRKRFSKKERTGEKSKRKSIRPGEGERALMLNVWIEQMFSVSNLSEREAEILRKGFGLVGSGGPCSIEELANEFEVTQKKLEEEFSVAIRKLRGQNEFLELLSESLKRKLFSLL